MADRISSLPDTLISHILSFLPTKQAIATSVLSKRWRPLWLSVSTLHFDDESYSQNKKTYFRFLQLVYTAMLLRNATQPIERFNLKCVSSLCDTSIVNTWVMAAMQRKVERIGLFLPSTVNLPCCILTSTTLVVLKLSGLTVNRVSSVGLPSLKTLQLRRVHFLERRDLFEILSACPVLVDLQLSSLQFTNLLSHGELKKLPKLVKADLSNSFTFIPVETFCNVEFLRTEVVMLSPSYVENHTFLNLTYLELIFLFHNWDWLIRLLHHCPNLHILVIGKMENGLNITMDDKSWVYPESVPNCLSSGLRRCCVRKYEGQEGELQFARYILQNARVLCALTIHSTSSSTPEAKLQMIKKLSSCPRISVTCELSFE